MKRLQFIHLFVLISFLMFAQGCASADKMLESGDYDGVIQLAQRKLTGKQKKNPKLVAAAEKAYARVMERDLAEVNRLKRSSNDSKWGRINSIYRTIRKRQEALAPLLPLTDKNGYTAYFETINVDELEDQSRQRAASYHYAEGEKLLTRAKRSNDKTEARRAYREFDEAQKYYRNYKNSNELKREAHRLGTSHILVQVENTAPVVVPASFERQLKQINTAELNSQWEQYHVNTSTGITYDYRIRFDIRQINISPERIREREYTDTKEIEDGFDYVLDDNGNVMKDSLGNDIKVTRHITIQAFVLEVLQQKEAEVRGVAEFFSLPDNRLIKSQPLNAVYIFENYASTFKGDERALSKDSKNRIGNRPVPFPSDEALIIETTEELKSALFNQIKDYRSLVRA